MYKNRSKGFTLIELLVVIAIIGILSAIVLASLGTARDKANAAAAQEGMTSLRAQNELYYSTAGNYGSAAGTGTITNTAVEAGLTGVCADVPTKKLLKAIAKSAGNTVTCTVGNNGTTWLAYVTLPNQTSLANMCVDSNGFGGNLTTAPAHIDTNARVSCK